MKRATVVTLMIALSTASTLAQTPPPSQPTGKTLAATVAVFVFPAEGQTTEQQSKDEVTCYNWAVQNTGTDPFALAQQSAAQQAQAAQAKEDISKAGRGAGAKGALGGAAAGALIGEIANDDAGKGAAYGAAAGMIAGRRRSRKAKKSASAQVEQQSKAAQQATGQQLESFRKAFSVCLEAKDYMVKF